MIGRSALTLAAARAANRVLGDYPGARQRLAGHAGKTLDIASGPLAFALRIGAQGLAEPVGEGSEQTPALTLRIDPADWPALAREGSGAWQRVQATGDSELAQLIGELARELRWDYEEDLSHWIGDVAAHRVAGSLRDAVQWQRDSRDRLVDALAEGLTEETRAFITRDEAEAQHRAIEALRDDTARLEARLNRLTLRDKDPA
ncbi:MAG TPA: hypothetical protein VFV17_10690 [Usitatibacteraceae bacterium]|nr:hypothetical protein [Usitatibacteraceae bacterium]